jgi:hypothetical protein
MALVAFQPDGDVWFYRKTASAKIRCATESGVKELLTSGDLKPATLVCQLGEETFEKANEHSKFSGILDSPEPPPVPILPAPPLLPAPFLKNFVATLLALIFGPVGLLYISWKLSLGTLILHIIACAMLGWSKWAVITFWHIVPFLIAYWKIRNANSLPDLLTKLASDSMIGIGVGLAIAKTKAGAFSSTLLQVGGFLYGGWVLYSNWFYSNWLQLIFFSIACIFASLFTFKVSLNYIKSERSGITYYYNYPFLETSDSLKRWLVGFAFVTLVFITFMLWKQPPGLMTGLVRVFLIVATFGLPFVPIFRGALGAVSIGIIGGIAALLLSSIPSGILYLVYRILTK